MPEQRGCWQSASLLTHKSRPKATSRRPLPIWSKASRRAINSRLFQYSIQTEIEVRNHLLRTIASLKFLDDATASPSKFCLALAQSRCLQTSIPVRMEYQYSSLNSVSGPSLFSRSARNRSVFSRFAIRSVMAEPTVSSRPFPQRLHWPHLILLENAPVQLKRFSP